MKTNPFLAHISKSNIEAIHNALVSSGNAHLASLVADYEDHSPEQVKYVSLAREYCNDDLEIDEVPLVSIGDSGAWVAAWIWIEGSEENLAVA